MKYLCNRLCLYLQRILIVPLYNLLKVYCRIKGNILPIVLFKPILLQLNINKC